MAYFSCLAFFFQVSEIKRSTFTLPDSSKPVELILFFFNDRTFVLLTDNGKVGSMYHCQPASPFSLDYDPVMVEQRILGCSPLHGVYAIEICKKIYPHRPLPVLLGLFLSPSDQLHQQRRWLQCVLQEIEHIL